MTPDTAARSEESRFVFPVGDHPFNHDKSINIQLNRWHSMDYRTKEEAESAGGGIRVLADWKGGLLGAGRAAVSQRSGAGGGFRLSDG